jgi:cell division protein FtsB
VVSSSKKFRRRRFALVIFVLLPIFLYAGFVFSRNLKTYNSLKAQLEKAQGELNKTTEENDQLKQEVEYTKTEDFIIQKARELLGYVKPGEVKFVDDGH